jgi:hypothetical protein
MKDKLEISGIDLSHSMICTSRKLFGQTDKNCSISRLHPVENALIAELSVLSFAMSSMVK